MNRVLTILALGCATLLVGCQAGDANWSASVLAKAENPNNGRHNFTSQRAEVIADHCGLFHPNCSSVRLLDETGFANAQGGRLFTYLGHPQDVSIGWLNEKTLQVRCRACDTKKIKRQLAQVNLVHIEYEL